MNSTAPLSIGRLTKVALREVWKHEALNFTAWLAENLDYLTDVVGYTLSFVAREHSVGPFFVDILVEDPAGRRVIIENQLESTDHDHLGKMITYMSNLDARAAIWITSNPRPEHEKAVEWLNEFLPLDMHFYLIKVEAVRIGESPAAPIFSVIAGPSDISAAIGREKKDVAERHVNRLAFWEELLKRASEKTQLHSRISPGTENKVMAGAGISGVSYSYAIRMNDSQVELIIDANSATRNKQIYDALYAQKAQIEQRFGAALVWERGDQMALAYVKYVTSTSGLRADASWPAIQDSMIDAMIRLERAFKPELASIR